MAKVDPAPELVPGPAFHLEGDGKWDVQELPRDVLVRAEYSGELEIDGYPAVVFEMPDGDQWAQKSPGTPAPKGASSFHRTYSLEAMAGRVASRTGRVRLEQNQMRAIRSLLEDLAESEKLLDRSSQYGRALRTEPEFEWLLDQQEALLESLREFRKGALESFEYILRTDLGEGS